MLIYSGACLLSILFARIGIHSRAYRVRGKTIPTILFSMLPLWFVSAFRYYCGTDYANYLKIFKNIRNHNLDNGIEWLFTLLNRFIAWLGGDYRWLMVVTSTIFLWFVFRTIFRDSPVPEAGIYLLVAMGYYFAAFNGIRQMCGAAILLFSLRYVQERKLFKFLICVIIAGGFHTTCFVFLPIYWISNVHIRPLFMILITAIIFLGSSIFANWINRVMLLTKYAGYATTGGDGDSRWISLLIYICVLAIASLFYQDDPKYRLYYNLQMIVVWFGALNTQVSWIRRIQWTFGLPSIILVPMVLASIKDSRVKNLLSFAVTILFAIYIYIITVRVGKHDVLPYRTFLKGFDYLLRLH